MDEEDTLRLQKRGRMAELADEIRDLSRRRDGLLRPLRLRLERTVPVDAPILDVGRLFDWEEAMRELKEARDVSLRLPEAVAEHNRLAVLLSLPPLKQQEF